VTVVKKTGQIDIFWGAIPCHCSQSSQNIKGQAQVLKEGKAISRPGQDQRVPGV